MFAVLQILFVLVAVAAIIVYIGKIKHKPASFVAGLCVLTIIASGISAKVISVIPMPTEQIRLTATGEKNEKALNDEVALSGIIADGKQYEVQNAVEGKWFWHGNIYMWRNENDIRQPKGTTRSITLDIPISTERKLVFINNKYRGIVEIEYNGKAFTKDLYSENSVTEEIQIPASDSIYVNFVKIGRLALFGLFIVVLIAYPVLALLRFDLDKIKGWFLRNWSKFVYAGIAICSFWMMVSLGWDNHQIWRDEVYNITFIYDGTLSNTIMKNLETADVNPPLFNIIAYFWFRIMPYGMQYLFLLCEIFVALSVYIMGLIGEVFKNKLTGILSSIIAGFSPMVYMNMAYEFRPAPLFFFTSSIVFLLYFKKMSSTNITTKRLVLLGVSYTAMVFTHYYGIFTVIALFFVDLLQCIKKKIKISFIIPYCMSGISMLIWFVLVFINTKKDLVNSSWKGTPSVKSLLQLVRYYCSNSEWLMVVFLVSIIGTISFSIYRAVKRNYDFDRDLKISMVPFVIIFCVSLPYIYSVYINPKNALFDKRYLNGLMPLVILVSAFGIVCALSCIIKLKKDKVLTDIIASSGVAVFMLIYCYETVSHDVTIQNENAQYSILTTVSISYGGAADYIMSQNDVYSPDTAVVMLNAELNGYNGYSYFLSHNRKRDKVNLFASCTLPNNILDYKTIYTCLWNERSRTPGKIITDNFDLISENKALGVSVYRRKQ